MLHSYQPYMHTCAVTIYMHMTIFFPDLKATKDIMLPVSSKIICVTFYSNAHTDALHADSSNQYRSAVFTN